MQFGQHVRMLRAQRSMTQQQLAERLGVSVSYISKVENDRLHFGDYPSEKFIRNLANELDSNEDDLLILANKVPATLRRRIHERPKLFRALADLDDSDLDQLTERLVKKRRFE